MVKKLLIDSIPIDHIIFSLLHAEIGVGNKVLDSFFEWVDYRVDKLSQNEINAKNEYIMAIIPHKEKVVKRDEWINQNGAQLAELRNERKELILIVNQRDDLNPRKFVLSKEERNNLTEQKQVIAEEIDALVKARSEIDAEVTAYNKSVSMIKKRVTNLKDKRGGQESVRMGLEQCLRKNKIDRAKYHGGQLEGKTVMLLFQKAGDIFNDMKICVLAAEPVDCPETEIKDMTKRYVEICTLFDGLFSLARTKSGEANDDIFKETEKYVKAVMIKWRDLLLSNDMLKIHGIEDHLVPQMKKFNGIGCFIEDFIEQAHQFGMLDESRTSNMRDRERAANCHCAWEEIGQNHKVINKRQEVSTRSRRNLKRNRLGERKQIDQNVKKEKKIFLY